MTATAPATTSLGDRTAGVAGIMAGVGLLVEGALWTATRWTPDTFGAAAATMELFDNDGTLLRAATFVGAINLVCTVLLVAGLAGRLRTAGAGTAASATLYFGVLGIGGHALVPLGLWLGVPEFHDLAAEDTVAAQHAWNGFAVFLAAAGGTGALFLGLSILATGLGAIRTRALSLPLAYLSVATGALTILTVATAATPIAAVGDSAYFPSLMLATVFRTWTGWQLLTARPRAD
ncbi:hypothetical protein [Nocardia brasiliensis]|uniref:hypothetical protein n=1 Tax=Nocardia brasiliensis TaxID=37326 RepID=UPI003D937DF8